MSERKPTPDVLADILGSSAAPSEHRPSADREPHPVSPRRSTPTIPAEIVKTAEKTHRWEYLVVSCQDYRGWRPRYEGGIERPDWTRGPLLPNYLTERGNEGWELVAACSGRSMFGVTDCYQLFFRRPVA
jgi:hypothetical protein